MKIIKRDASEETFNVEKIINAITKANNAGDRELTEDQINSIAHNIESDCQKINRTCLLYTSPSPRE